MFDSYRLKMVLENNFLKYKKHNFGFILNLFLLFEFSVFIIFLTFSKQKSSFQKMKSNMAIVY